MNTHETGGHPADQPAETDQSDRTETRNGGDTPRPAADHPWEVRAAEDPSNRESRGPDPRLGPPVYQGGNMGVDTRLDSKMKEIQEKVNQWEEKLKTVLRK